MTIKTITSTILKGEIAKIVPPLVGNFHKGQAGRVGIIGGCQLYTGAPYYSGISALKIGADLSWVFCSKSASVIKTYSPELIVLPVLPEGDEKIDVVKELMDKGLIERMHSFVIGPGLGRETNTLNSVIEVLEALKLKKKIIVCDGDMLYLISKYPELIKGYKHAILTPNATEYSRLVEAILTHEEAEDRDDKKKLNMLCEKLGHVTIIKKGSKDWICNGDGNVLICEEQGSNRRCGGQGDVLAGAIGVFAHWATWMAPNHKEYDPISLGCMGACMVVRHAAHLAFKKNYRSTTTPDIIEKLGESCQNLFPIEQH